MEFYYKCSITPPKDTSRCGSSHGATSTCFMGGYHVFSRNSGNPLTTRRFRSRLSSRTRAEVNQVHEAQTAKARTKTANLVARRKERVKLPKYDDDCQNLYPISKFLSQPSGFKSILNTKTLQDVQPLESNTYRCILSKIQLLNFEVAPMLDLRVTPTSEDCTVEMLSCKFEGSEVMERQNDRFSASMMNHITWNTDGERFLDVDMKLNISLEVYTRPFSILPVSAIEKPGNVVMQSLVDKLVPLLLQRLLQDYDIWVKEQHNVSR